MWAGCVSLDWAGLYGGVVVFELNSREMRKGREIVAWVGLCGDVELFGINSFAWLGLWLVVLPFSRLVFSV